MSPLQLLVILSGLAVTVVLGEKSYYDVADPPPLPAKGIFLLASTHEQSCAHIIAVILYLGFKCLYLIYVSFFTVTAP